MRKILFVAVALLCVIFTSNAQNSEVVSDSVVLRTDTGIIYGTLMIPAVDGKCPVVLIIAGSGPTDRNCNSKLGIQTDAYKLLAESLAAKGIATLRYDKRGIGASALAGSDESKLRFENYITDAQGWLVMLKSDNRFSKVGVLGHSEGSLIGMVAAREASADFYISVAGTAMPADEILLTQLKSNPAFYEQAKGLIAKIKLGEELPDVQGPLASLFRKSVVPYMKSWFAYNPSEELKKLKMPILIAQGTNDIQVNVLEATNMVLARPDAKTAIIPGMNHVLKSCGDSHQENLATYTNPSLPLATGFSDAIVAFVLSK